EPRRTARAILPALVLPALALAAIACAASARGQTAGPSSAAAPKSGVLIKMDERAMRAAGVAVGPIQKEQGGADFALPGNIVIPPSQVHVVAAPAAGLVEALLVSADEQVQAGQQVAVLRSPVIVEAQQLFLAAIADEALAADRLRRTQLLIEGKAI